MDGRRKNLVCGIAAVVSALLLWAAYPPNNESFAVIVALVPMFALLRSSSPGRSALFFFIFGFLYWILALSWMPAIIKNNGPWPLVLLGWFALAAACAGYFALFGYAAAWVWRLRRTKGIPSVACIFAEAVIWALCEYMRATLFTGFAWNFLGTAFASMPSFATPARFGGVYLVSALTVLLNGVFATLLMRVFAPVFHLDWPNPIRPSMQGGGGTLPSASCKLPNRLVQVCETGLPLLVILACLCLGNRMVAKAMAHGEDTAAIRVALVQRNAPCVFSSRRREDAHEAFMRLIDVTAAAKPDLLVLAESAMAEFGAVRSQRAQAVAHDFIVRAGAKSLIAGGDDVLSNRTYNAAVMYSVSSVVGGGMNESNSSTFNVQPSTTMAGVYRKQHLVPFGEYIPFDKWIPALQKLSPIGVSLYPGEPALFEVPAADGRMVKAAPLICYEDTDPRLAAKAARMGAGMIILITNDSWFSCSAEAEAHAAQAVLRAIETGLTIVRVGNSGVSGVIRPDGSARWLSDANGKPLTDAQGVMVETVFARCGKGG